MNLMRLGGFVLFDFPYISFCTLGHRAKRKSQENSIFTFVILIRENKMDKDIRWQQRFVNFNKAFNQLSKFIVHEELNEMEEQGLIKAFEYTYELSST